MGLSILPTNQGALQADVKTPLSVIGEIKGIEITRGAHVFRLDASVVGAESSLVSERCA